MTYKLKHLSKYCCKPETETEFEAVKMAAELGGVEFYEGNCFGDGFTYFYFSKTQPRIAMQIGVVGYREEIPVLEFCRKLRMTEEEVQALEDDRVVFTCDYNNYEWTKIINAATGYHFRLSEDSKECYLVKDNPTV